VITEYAESTDYEDEFAEMNECLREINENIKTDSTETCDTLVEEPVPD
jgi:hypothetical protein